MTTIVVGILPALFAVLCLALVLYLASGAWCCLRLRRHRLSERDFRESERYAAQRGVPGAESVRLLAPLDLALQDALAPGAGVSSGGATPTASGATPGGLRREAGGQEEKPLPSDRPNVVESPGV